MAIENFIVDFFCPKAKLVIEIDGGQHYYEKGLEADKLRDSYITNLGLRVLRFTKLDVLQNIEGVLEHINEYLKYSPQSPFTKWDLVFISPPFIKEG